MQKRIKELFIRVMVWLATVAEFHYITVYNTLRPLDRIGRAITVVLWLLPMLLFVAAVILGFWWYGVIVLVLSYLIQFHGYRFHRMFYGLSAIVALALLVYVAWSSYDPDKSIKALVAVGFLLLYRSVFQEGGPHG